MRSVIAFAALALTSGLNLAAAGPCRPKSRTTSSQSESLTFTDATGTLSASATTTETGGDIIITNAARNGRFAIADPDSESGISAFNAEGKAQQHEGGCFQEDGSNDDGCVSLEATGSPSGNNKRALDLGTLAAISQILGGLSPSTRTLYTVRFYYAVLTGSGSNMCSINAYLGSQQFYSSTIFTNGPTASWNQVLETVVAESTSAAFRIAMSCSGNGFAMIYVDSVFISNQVTPANINDFILNFGDSQSNNPQSTTASIAPVETFSSTEWPLTATEFPSTDRTSQPETRTIEPATESQTDSTPEPGTFTPGPSTETEGVETWTSTSGPRTETEDPEQHTSGSLTQAASESTSYSQAETTTGWTSQPHTAETSESAIDQTTATPTGTPTTEATTASESMTAGPWIPVASAVICPDGYNPPGFCGQKWPVPSKPTCERVGAPDATWRSWPISQKPNQRDIQQCALTCAQMDYCRAFAWDRSNSDRPCRFLFSPLSQYSWQTNPASVDRLEWSDLDCFNCQLCDEKRGAQQTPTSEWQTTSPWIGTQTESVETPRTPTTPSWQETTPGQWHTPTTRHWWETETESVEPQRTPTTRHWWETTSSLWQTPSTQSWSESTPSSSPDESTPTTSAAATATCSFTHGETCSLVESWKFPKDGLCVYGAYYTRYTYEVSRDEFPYQDDRYQCAAICKQDPNCKSFAWMQTQNKCLFTPFVIKAADMEILDDPRGHALWSDIRCWTCPECVAVSDTTTAVPTSTEYPTTTEYSTTTSSALSQPTCSYTHGEKCEFDRFTDHSNVLCIYASHYTGETWKESRSDYPYQDDPYQCAAICQNLPDCQSSGYYSTENRCYFTSATIKTSDMHTYLDSESWKNSIWSDRSCWTCPECVVKSEPAAPDSMCSYTDGDECTPNSSPSAGALCGYSAYVGGGYIQETLDRFPNQDSNADCAAICRAMTYCKASSSYGGRCMFFVFELTTSRLQQLQGGSKLAKWDDPSCWTCPGCTN